jgi:Rps23 Pro-64 3,4-dihydroxylase Tpa1-like proline 4-hydroxylase
MIDLTIFEKLKTSYQGAYPFPYVVIDNFLPEFIMTKCLEELQNHKEWSSNKMEWVEPFQVNKFFIPDEKDDIEYVKSKVPITSLILDYLNTPKFLKHLENLTGIKKLFRDPLLMGGGVHKINRGGKLSIHIDYNNHPTTKHRRKLNLLIYLNKDWDKSWGSNLELWDKELTKKVIEVEPIFNRAVIFTIDDAPHGHPYPLNCPENVSRYSLALYYFIDEEPEEKHSVIFYRNDEVGITDNNNSYDKIFKTN